MRKFKRIVHASLFVVLVLTSGNLTSAFAQSKDEIVNGSYFVAFGRFANQGELNYWKNAGNYTVAQLVEMHRDYLSRDRNEKIATINRAYMDAFGWNPSSSDIDYWSKLNKTYGEIMTVQMNTLRNNSKSRTLVIQQSYYRSFNKLPDAAQLQYWLNQSPYSFAQLVAFHSTWKNQGRNTSSITQIQGSLNQNGISTFNFSPQAISAVVAAGGGNVVAAGGGNVVAAGGANVVAAGGRN
jgi:hypothetical protein